MLDQVLYAHIAVWRFEVSYHNFTGMADLSDTSRWWFKMSPYCSAHDEWLIMKLCMYVGYHDANNVSNFGGDPVIQLYGQ